MTASLAINEVWYASPELAEIPARAEVPGAPANWPAAEEVRQSGEEFRPGLPRFAQATWFKTPLTIKATGLAQAAKKPALPNSQIYLSLTLDHSDFALVTGSNPDRAAWLIQVLVGLIRPGQGQVYFNDQNLARLSPSELAAWRQICFGTLTRYTNGWPSLSLLDNLLLPYHSHSEVAFRHYEAEALRLLKLTGLEIYKELPLAELPATHTSLFALLRVLIKQPKLLVYRDDEASGPVGMPPEPLFWELLATYRKSGGIVICTTTPAIYSQWLASGQLPADHYQLTLQ